MKFIQFTGSILILLLLVMLSGSFSFADQDVTSKPNTSTPLSMIEQLRAIEDEVNPAAWNIRNGCVTLSRIKRIKFIDDQTALVSMRGKKKVILRLRRQCPGIRHKGYVHEASSRKLCVGFDRFSTFGSGYSCRIESLEPYINIEEPQPENDFD